MLVGLGLGGNGKRVEIWAEGGRGRQEMGEGGGGRGDREGGG